jgi:cytochrome P450
MTISETDRTAAQGSPFAAAHIAERRDAYQRLAEQGPVQRIILPDGEPAWLVTEYHAARAALADPRLVKQRPPGSIPYSGLPHDLDVAIRSTMLIGIRPSTPGCASWSPRRSPTDGSARWPHTLNRSPTSYWKRWHSRRPLI